MPFCCCRKLARLSQRNKANSELVCESACNNKSPAFYASNNIYALVFISIFKNIQNPLKPFCILQQGCYVPEHYSLLWKMRNSADFVFYEILIISCKLFYCLY